MPVLVYPKWWLKSKTMILNLLSLLFVAIPAITGFLSEVAALPEFSPFAGVILAIINVLNIIVRFRTLVPVALSRSAPPEPVPGTGPVKRRDYT